MLNVSCQTDQGGADCEFGKVCMVVYIKTVGTHQANYFIPLTKRLQDEFSFLENSDFNFKSWLLCMSSQIVLLAVLNRAVY